MQITGTPTQTGNFTPQLTITSGTQTATVKYSLSIAAPVFVSISDRVFGGDRTAYMILTNDQGESRRMPIITFGYYRFSEVVVAGRTYTLAVQSKRYVYQPQVLFVTEDRTNVDFYPTNDNARAPNDAEPSLSWKQTGSSSNPYLNSVKSINR